MLQSASLQIPANGKGRSRFSKALPAIPGLDTSDLEPPPASSPSIAPKIVSPPTSASVPVSTPKLREDLPPPPTPLANDDPRTPIQYTPLPPIPGAKTSPSPPIFSPGPTSISIPTTVAQTPMAIQTPTTAKTPKTAMMIPRRPVGGSKPPAAAAAPAPISHQPQQPLHQSQPSLSKSLPQPQIQPQQLPSQTPPQAALPPKAPHQAQPSLSKALPQPHSQRNSELQQTLPRQMPPSLVKPFPLTPTQAQQQPQQSQTPSAYSQLPSQSRALPLAHQQLPSQSNKPPQVQPQQQYRPKLEEQTQQKPEPVQKLLSRERQASLSKPLPQPQPEAQVSPQERRAPQIPPFTHQTKFSFSQLQLQPQPEAKIAVPTQVPRQSLPPQTIETSNQQQLPPFLPSPSESLSSLLSAYSRSSTQSIVRSSDGTISARESGTNDSVHDDAYLASTRSSKQQEEHDRASTPATVTNANINGLQLKQGLPRKPIADGSPATPTAASPPPPPPPSKDDRGAQRPSSPTRNPTMNTTSTLATPSSPRPQIWRRRSLKGSKDLPDLKLDYSHGSTAASQSVELEPQQPQVATRPEKSNNQYQKSFSGVIGLPGRNVRPGQPTEQPADSHSIMGHGASKFKQLKDRFHPTRRSKDETIDPKKLQASSRPAAYRPPTPEYQKEDVKTPILETFVSPVSPASSPEPLTEVSPELPGHQLPPISTQVEAHVSKALPPAPAAQLPKSLPDLKGKAPLPVHEPPPPIYAAPSSGRNSPALEVARPTRGRQPEAGGRTGARNSSARPDSRNRNPVPRPDSRDRSVRPDSRNQSVRPDSRNQSARPDSRNRNPVPRPDSRDRSVRPDSRNQSVRQDSRNQSARPDNRRPFPGPDGDSRFVRSSSGELLYRGRDGTLYPEMKELPEPEPEAARFPMPAAQPMPEGTIIKARPLNDSHYDCFQKHRSMVRRNNKRCPLSCQTCEKEDAEDRWSCTFCNLRMCESCLGTFEANKRDLYAFMNDLGGHKTLSLSSPSRPGSALGLRLMS